MAAKMQCPKCKKILKEKGDDMKQAQGEYVVNNYHATRMLKCLECKHEDFVVEFEPR